MLKIIQIITLIQGLLFFCFIYLSKDKKTTFGYYLSLFSIILYIIGDDQNNLFIQNTDWFLFDNTLL
jgi:ATP/ADP translocase